MACCCQYFLWQDKTTPLEKRLYVKISAFLTLILKEKKKKELKVLNFDKETIFIPSRKSHFFIDLIIKE